MGTPDFAATILLSLLQSRHEVAAVFTRPDKRKGRNREIVFPPVKTLGIRYKIPVFQPPTLKSADVLETLERLNPDCVTVAAYGLILPKDILALPKYGCVNVHASLLPEYRGAAPINRCIMDGSKESGVTIMQMDEGLDTGGILLSERVGIPDSMTASELHDVLAKTGARLLPEALDKLENGGLSAVAQDDSLSSYAAKIDKSECEIDFTKPARDVCNHIRALADCPGAYTFVGGKRLKVYRAVIREETERAGTAPSPDELTVVCGDKRTVSLTQVQPEGGRRMKIEDFLRGRDIGNIR
jgi:methionyl-tRNA formyltransferase